MKTRATLLICSAMVCILTACVSTSTGSGARFEQSNDAANQNYQLGAQYFKNGKYELALDRLQRAIKLDAKNAKAHSLLALTHERLGNSRLATESHARAVRLAPEDHNVRNAYAVFLCQTGEIDSAREQFDRASRVRENDDVEVTLTNAGVCMAKKPDVSLAEQYFRDALDRNPNYGEALLRLAVLQHQGGDSLRARAFLQRYLDTNKATAEVLDYAIQVENELDDDRGATDYTNQLLREFPESLEARKYLTPGN